MPLGLLGVKVGMTQIYDQETGEAIPVTVLQVGPCPVLQIRDVERDGYDAVQLGYRDKPRRKAIRAERGHVSNDLVSKRRPQRENNPNILPPPKKADCEPQRFIREFRLKEPPTDIEVGKLLTVANVFADIKKVDVTGTSKGRGFAGVMKRWNFHGLRATHGAKKVHRSGGSISSHSSDLGGGRIKKGGKAAGQYGNARVTTRNLELVSIDEENHLALVRGAVPGPNGGYVMIRPTNKG